MANWIILEDKRSNLAYQVNNKNQFQYIHAKKIDPNLAVSIIVKSVDIKNQNECSLFRKQI